MKIKQGRCSSDASKKHFIFMLFTIRLFNNVTPLSLSFSLSLSLSLCLSFSPFLSLSLFLLCLSNFFGYPRLIMHRLKIAKQTLQQQKKERKKQRKKRAKVPISILQTCLVCLCI